MQAFGILGLLIAVQMTPPLPVASDVACTPTQSELTSAQRTEEERAYDTVLDQGVPAAAPVPDYGEELRAAQERLVCVQRLSLGDDALAQAFGSVGLLDEQLGDYTDALTYGEQAEAIFTKHGELDAEAYAYNEIGDAQISLGQYAAALTSYQHAVALFGDESPPNSGAMAISYNGVAIAQDREGKYQAALQSMTRAQAELGGPSRTMLATLGLVNDHLRHYSDSVTAYNNAIASDQNAGDTIEAAEATAGLADAQLHGGNAKEALLDARRAAALDTELHIPAWQNLATAAAAEAKLDLVCGAVRCALRDYDKAIREIEQLRGSVSAAERSSYFSTTLYVYDDYITYLLELDRRFPHKGYDKKALEIFERRQGRAFLEEVGQSAARSFAGALPPDVAEAQSLAEQAQGLQSELAALSAKGGGNPDAVASLREQLTDVGSQQAAFDARIEKADPSYYAILHPQPLQVRCSAQPCTSFTQFQASILRPGEAVLVYDVLANETALWVITKQGKQAVTLFVLDGGTESNRVQGRVDAFSPKTCAPNGGRSVQAVADALSAGVAGVSNADIVHAARNDARACDAASFALYSWLFPREVQRTIAGDSMLFIVPTGPLYSVPFEALITKSPATGATPQYLLDGANVAYLSSASLLDVLRTGIERRRSTPSQPLLAFADPDYTELSGSASSTSQPEALAQTRTLALRGYVPGSGAFPPLFGSETEAVAAFKALDVPATATTSSLYQGDRASLQSIDALNAAGTLKTYRYVLFGTHAVLPNEVSGVTQPAIVLAHPETLNDYLTMGDVFGLSFGAQAVVLSACDSGVGEVNGDSVQGLTQAFMYANTPVVGVTDWEVVDRIQAKLTPQFFAGMAHGLTPAAALRQAKLALIRSGNVLESNPFFWAPMVIFGDGSAR
jgi:CHAT domain-containing protein/tetratricopeptide (TPR) repeat protein